MNKFIVDDEALKNNESQVSNDYQNENLQDKKLDSPDINYIKDEENTENIEGSKNQETESGDLTEKIEIEDANTTNCLALTIKEEHKLVAIRNVFLHSLKVTWKVIASTVALHIIKIFLK